MVAKKHPGNCCMTFYYSWKCYRRRATYITIYIRQRTCYSCLQRAT